MYRSLLCSSRLVLQTRDITSIPISPRKMSPSPEPHSEMSLEYTSDRQAELKENLDGVLAEIDEAFSAGGRTGPKVG
jgi:hypothetical protein